MATKASKASNATLLVELLTEELPPKSLAILGRAFAEALHDGLVSRSLLLTADRPKKILATPRRLAAVIPNVLDKAADRAIEVTGPSVKAPPEAVAGFAKKQGVEVKDLEQRESPKGLVYLAKATTKGVSLDGVLASLVADALKKLPIAKTMRWGDGEAQFVRPVHGLLMLHGKRVVPGEVLGLKSGNRTAGHRFLGKPSMEIKDADDYEATLEKDGNVMADFAARRAEIERQLNAEAKKQNAALGRYEDLLDEVTALVELPAVYLGAFEQAFLEVPQECLILTMRQNQKYFPLFDERGGLLARFLIVSNMAVRDPRHIIAGNERVVRPRLDDARFFFDQDRKVRLETRVSQLSRMVFQRKLGSQMERVRRLQRLASAIAQRLGADAQAAERAALLAKADLTTGMVGEFPELQGVMGRYYALHDGEAAPVADAIEAHYRPRFSGDDLPEGALACALALADKLDSLAGLFGAGEQPGAEKDPFALRRQALGVLRILMEKKLPLSLPQLIAEAAEGYKDLKILGAGLDALQPFMRERLRNLLREQGYEVNEIEAVMSPFPERIDLVSPRLDAVRAFRKLPQAESLSTANKRIRNILRKSEHADGALDEALLSEPEERRLLESVARLQPQVAALIEAGQFTKALQATSTIEPLVTAFFEKILVNAEDQALRASRHALLKLKLDPFMNQVADISKLAVEK